MRSQWNNGGASGDASSSVSLLGQTFGPKFLVCAWVYFDTSGLTSPIWQNMKPWRFHSSGATNPSCNWWLLPPSDWVGPFQMDGISSPFCAEGDGFSGSPGGYSFWPDAWHQLLWLCDMGSGNGTTDGKVRTYVDAVPNLVESSCRASGAGQTSFPEWYLGNYVRTGDWGGTARIYWDSVYVDNAWARVEIGDNAVYGSCTHREIQKPTAWADGSITFVANRGSFASLSGKYLFVIDEDNTPSAGFLMS